MSLSKMARTSGTSPRMTDIAMEQPLRTLPAGLLPALPHDPLLRVLSLLEPAEVAAAAEAFPEVAAVTRAEWAWRPLWRGKRFQVQAADVGELLAVVRAAPPCDKAAVYVGWPVPALATTSTTKGIVSLGFGAANNMKVLCDLRANLERIVEALSLRAKQTTVIPYEPLPPQLPLEWPVLHPAGYMEATRLFWNRSHMAVAVGSGAGPGHPCFTQLDVVKLSHSSLWTLMGASAGALHEPGRALLRSLVLRYDPRVAAAEARRTITHRDARGLRRLDATDSPWRLAMCFPRSGTTASADSLMLTDDEVVDVATARKSPDYDDLNNNSAKGGRSSSSSSLSRQDSSSDEEFLYIVLTCCDCKDLFPTGYQLLLHRLDAHSDRRPYQCPACMATFKRPDLLAEHRATHTEHEPHPCPHCSARFTLKSHVKAHGRVMHPEHHQPQQHQCSACSGLFQSAAGLASHMRCHAEAGLRGTPKPFACKKCDCRFKQRSNLYSHTKRNHPSAIESACAKE